MLSSIILVALLSYASADLRWYETYGGNPITEEQYQAYVANGTTSNCVIQAEDCRADEGRRLDNTCNNLNNPVRGARFTVQQRLLPAAYGDNFEPRLAKSGNPLPLNRRVRTHALLEGSVPSPYFTHLLTNSWLFTLLDNTLSQDTLNYVINIPYCCEARGRTDPMCTPNAVPNDDPVHRFSEVRCMNMTRPTSYQNQGCIRNDTNPDRLNAATTAIDLSFLYGGVLSDSLRMRLNQSGLMRFETDEQGRIWPPSIQNNPQGTCRLNQPPDEVRCNETPVPVTNTLLGANLFTVWWYRHHNRVARELARVNPSWDDDRLFYTARDINIAIANQIYYYELLPLMFGRERMINDNVITADGGFRDLYNETVAPFMTYEYLYSLRWVHTIQEGIQKMYDQDGYYVKEIPVGNLTFRTGYLTVDNNMEYITQGTFRQPCGHADYAVDPFVAEVSLGPLQRSLDLLVNDNAKARYFGLQPYVRYLEYCNAGSTFNTWESLSAFIDPERVNMLRNVYEDVEDVDLLAGIWVERPIEGGFVPPTLYCLTTQQLVRNLVTDRHFFERPNRPNAFTAAQLAEIRNSTIAKFVCDVADGVTQIQPSAFQTISAQNPLTSCNDIDGIDFSVWAESSEEA